MPIKSTKIFANECVLQGLFLGVNPHFLMAVAKLRSGINDDVEGDRIGPFRVTQQEWDANGGAADLEVILDPQDITDWRLQCLYAALTSYRAQNRVLEHLGRYPSAVELYKEQWPNDRVELPAKLQEALDATAGFMDEAITDAQQPAPSPESNPEKPTPKKGTEIFVTKAPRIMEKLIDDFGLKDFQAAAILGNIGEECDGFNAMQEKHPVVPGSRGGFGWAQWTGSRRTDFEAFCSDRGLSPVSDAANYGFLKIELSTSQSESINALKNASNISKAVRAFEAEFERAKAGLEHFDLRDSWSKLALKSFNDSAAARVPAAVARILDPDLIYRVIATITDESTTFWVITQFTDDGNQVLVKQDDGQAPIVLASDTTVFPIKAGLVPEAVAARLSAGFHDVGDPHPPINVPSPVTDDNINARVFAEARKSVDTLITRNVPNTDHGNLACAFAVNEVIRRAIGKPIGGGLSTTEMGKVLKDKHTEVAESNIAAGMIVISPTGRKVGHVGIIGMVAAPMSATPIYSNSSRDGKFEQNFSVGKWKKRYIDVQGLPVLYYALKN